MSGFLKRFLAVNFLHFRDGCLPSGDRPLHRSRDGLGQRFPNLRETLRLNDTTVLDREKDQVCLPDKTSSVPAVVLYNVGFLLQNPVAFVLCARG
jgi:hypothetical protein